MPIAYLKTKGEFLEDAPRIADIVREAVRQRLGRRTSPSEYTSWNNSLGNAVYHLLNNSGIPDSAGLAIEYQIRGSAMRIDLLISGHDRGRQSGVVIVELKQWSDDAIVASDLEDHVLLRTDGATHPHEHPSAQALDYAFYFEGFFTAVVSGEIHVYPCAFAHNVRDSTVLRACARPDTLEHAPLFTRDDAAELRTFVAERVVTGDQGASIDRLEASPLSPSKDLAAHVGNLVGGNPEFRLMDRQRTAVAQIKRLVKEAGPLGRRVLIVRGGPGTGKSVIAFHALGQLLQQGRNARYVTKNAAPRSVYFEKLRAGHQARGLRGLLVSSDTFHDYSGDPYDVLLVDEAHRLVHKSGIYRNLGSNQVLELMGASRVTVFFLDESQAVTWRDMGTRAEILSCADRLGIPVTEVELTMQFRCTGADDYVDWVDRILGITPGRNDAWLSGSYLVDVVDSPRQLDAEVGRWNEDDPARRSRIVAGYCWDWVSRSDPQRDDIVLADGFSRQWNLTAHGQGWMAHPNGDRQVGCVYTVQGLEAPFVGVIMGPDLVVRNGRWVFDPSARAKTDRQSLWGWKNALRSDPEAARARAEQIVRNQYRVLMTRGTQGTLLYSTDAETREFLRAQIHAAKLRSSRVA